MSHALSGPGGSEQEGSPATNITNQHNIENKMCFYTFKHLVIKSGPILTSPTLGIPGIPFIETLTTQNSAKY